MKLIFTGLKHSGKTTFARLTAEHFNTEWKDSDDLILERIKPLTIREFYKSKGKLAFMDAESKCVLSYIEKNDNFVLSLGGGVADNSFLMDKLNESGFIIYLVREEKVLLKKILEKGGIPPFLDQNDVESSFHTLYLRRDAVYRKYADLIIDLGPYGDKNETLIRILNAIEEAEDVR